MAETTRRNYPDLRVPLHSRWRHFEIPRYDGPSRLSRRLSRLSPDEKAKTCIDLVVTSVLLDAGAGPAWRFREAHSGILHGRSEGLAIASFELFASGGFSSRRDDPWRADADRLASMGADDLAGAFQVTEQNRLIGLDERAALLRNLAAAMRANANLFGPSPGRVGNIFDYFSSRASGGKLSARVVLAAVLEGLSSIWPGRVELKGENLGDVWRYPRIHCNDETSGLVPFHKLSQWLCYSLVEPLEAAGLEVTELDALTGLAEYRNGGLLVDLGVLEPVDTGYAERTFAVDAELVVEWRALTIGCLDELLPLVRRELALDDRGLTLSQLMQGGTWSAGRRSAGERREDGASPINVISDGTVF